MYLSVVIPAYNEEKRIKKTLFSVDGYLYKQSYQYEILVVNDGSNDGTVAVINDLIPQIRGLKLINNEKNHGKGWAVQQGILKAKGIIRLFMDADNSTSINQIENFMPFLNRGYDIIIGSRRVKESRIAVKQSRIRDFLGGVFRFVVRILIPLGITDSQAGFKIFSKEAALSIFPKQTIFRWAFDVEILAIAETLDFRIKEAPIKWINDSSSKVKISGMIQMLFELFQIRWNLWTRKYGHR